MIKKEAGNTLLIVAIIAIVAIVIGVFFLTIQKKPSPQPVGQNKETAAKPVAQWVVYPSVQYGFEIRFPEYCDVNDAYLGNQYAFSLGITSKQWASGQAVVLINHGNMGTEKLKEFVTQLQPKNAAAKLSDTKFAKNDAVKAESGDKVSYFFVHNLDVYELYKTGPASKEMDEIMKSFKFNQ